jgi:hypothetical protein
MLVDMGLLIRKPGFAVVTPLSQIEQTTGRKKAIESRIAGLNSPIRPQGYWWLFSF